MPKDTFLNLPEEKRERIENAAIKEFSEYSFDASSINRIVENSEISKGSFYQYFQDKKDLYKHIIGIIADKKLKYMSPILANPFEQDIFTLIREMYVSGLNFAKENPQLLEIGNKLIADPSNPIYDEIMRDNRKKSDEVFKQLLKKAVDRGEIRQHLDLNMVAYLLTILNISVVDYYLKQRDIREYSQDMMEIVEKFIDIIQHGIANEGGKK